MFKRLTKLEELVPKVVEWDRKTPYNYDHRWINLHGMDAMLSGLDAGSSSGKPATLIIAFLKSNGAKSQRKLERIILPGSGKR